jgi:hypothetical protein
MNNTDRNSFNFSENTTARDLDQWEREHERAKAEFYAFKEQLSDDERGI